MKNVKKMITATAVASALLCGSAIARPGPAAPAASYNFGSFTNTTGYTLTVGTLHKTSNYAIQVDRPLKIYSGADIVNDQNVSWHTPSLTQAPIRGFYMGGFYKTDPKDQNCPPATYKTDECTFVLKIDTKDFPGAFDIKFHKVDGTLLSETYKIMDSEFEGMIMDQPKYEPIN